jgi:hypothetical protein
MMSISQNPIFHNKGSRSFFRGIWELLRRRKESSTLGFRASSFNLQLTTSHAPHLRVYLYLHSHNFTMKHAPPPINPPPPSNPLPPTTPPRHPFQPASQRGSRRLHRMIRAAPPTSLQCKHRELSAMFVRRERGKEKGKSGRVQRQPKATVNKRHQPGCARSREELGGKHPSSHPTFLHPVRPSLPCLELEEQISKLS